MNNKNSKYSKAAIIKEFNDRRLRLFHYANKQIQVNKKNKHMIPIYS